MPAIRTSSLNRRQLQTDTRFGVLDLMQWIPGIDADHAYPVLDAAATTVSVFGGQVRVCSLEHLRSMKLAADRPQDRIDLEQLAIAQGDEPGDGL